MKIAFFGSPDIAVVVLNELKKVGIVPSLVVSNPDAPVGRKQILTPPPVALWVKENNITLFQPTNLKEKENLEPILNEGWDLFVVVAYGKILPKWLIDLPNRGTINLHPSLLPALRGASPIRSAILGDIRETGVTIMQMDDKMDHGPIIAQTKTLIEEKDWPIDGQELDMIMAKQGGELLASLIPSWLNGEITPAPQNHDEATFCTKITKDMSELQIDPHQLPLGKEAYDALLKIRAFAGWPETFFLYEGKRIKIKNAHLDEAGRLCLSRIVPEGKKEMDFKTYFSK
jgi:methionyl-tRNA formyltransferase